MESGRAVKIFAVVVTYNGERWIDRCLTSLLNSSYSIDIVVVDNNSTDGTPDTITTRYPSVHLIRNSYNAGFGQANNQGIAFALRDNAAYVFLLNQDAWINGGCIEQLVNGFDSDEKYGILSPLHLAPSGKLDRGFENCLLKERSPSVVSGYIESKSLTPEPAEFINAAAWMVSRKCLEIVGGFGPLFFHYGEDRDYTQRLHHFNLKLGVVSAASIVHDRDDRSAEHQRNTKEKLIRYYFVGSLVRVANLQHGFSSAVVSTNFWIFKELMFLFIKGRGEAFPVMFIVQSRFTKKWGELRDYRKSISANTPFRFLEVNK